eukprot:352150-Chlamydomonas_euryale.AAC.4
MTAPPASHVQAMNLEVARKAFIRIRDVRYVELVNKTEAGKKQGLPESLLMAEIMAYMGRYQDAARLYTQAGCVDKVRAQDGGRKGGGAQYACHTPKSFCDKCNRALVVHLAVERLHPVEQVIVRITDVSVETEIGKLGTNISRLSQLVFVAG